MNQEILGVDLFRLFLAENIIPDAIVPNGIQEEPLIDGLEHLFYRVLDAHLCENNQERQEIYDYIQREYVDEWPQEHLHFINDFSNFLHNLDNNNNNNNNNL